MTTAEVLSNKDAPEGTFEYQAARVTAQKLLERYNPALVLLPRDTSLKRPGSWWRGNGRGDYHPCSAEFFISKLAWYPKRRGLFKKPSKKSPEEPGLIQGKVETEGKTDDWEIDIAGFNSGDAKKAWHTYGDWLAEPEAQKCVTYGRCKQVEPGDPIALQYWYLYLYNDAGNTHEGDWETVTIELDPVKGPTQVGYSGHNGGARRRWQGIARKGDHPLVYVARGSHAAYLDHMPLGHKTAHLEFDKALPSPLKEAVILLEKVAMKSLYFWGVRDYTCSIDDEGDGNQGSLFNPEVRVMPDRAALNDKQWWWMNINCPWGSSHSRIRDFIAPEPPWMKTEKWDTPLAWLGKQPER